MPGPSWVRAYTGASSYDENGDFVAGRSGRSLLELSPEERSFVESWELAETIAESSDPNASYDYDDWALARLNDTYYVFNTSGCSCPAPEETWGLAFSGDRDALLGYLVATDRASTEAWNEFLRECERAGVALRDPAPAWKTSRYDW